jgi:DNA-directed RNA polymerase
MALKRLKASMAERLLDTRDKRNTNRYFWEVIAPEDTLEDEVVERIVDMTLGPVLMALRSRSMLTETAIGLGSKVRRNMGIKEDPLNETKISLYLGLKLLEAYCNKDKPKSKFKLLGIEKMQQRKQKGRHQHATYHLKLTSQKTFDELWATIDVAELEESPRSKPSADWTSGYHQDGHTLIRRGNADALQKVSRENCPVVLDALNKLQNTAYSINEPVFEVYKTMFEQQDRDKIFSSDYEIVKKTPFKHEKEERQPSREGMYLEADAILVIAETFLDRPFYHRYNCDFRSRIYPGSSYLHEQSSDNAKGLIQYQDSVPLGDNGAYWLAIHTANSFGEDKLRLDERAIWCEERMDQLIACAEDPYNNTLWIQGEKPWTVLACCYEWARLRDWTILGGNEQSTFESKIPLYIDGSNNGVQHLTALSLDDTVAHLVNLVPTDLPGDVYMYVAEKVWEELAELDKQTDPELTKNMSRYIQEITDIKLKMGTAETKEEKDKVFKEADAWRTEHKEQLNDMWVPFWMRLADNKKLQRKTVKRPVMTLGYGVTKMGVREQVFDDTKTLSEELKFKEKKWVNPFGDLLMDTTLKNMPGPAAMLDLFRELAVRANSKSDFLQWDIPITNFPVVQAYEATKEQQVEAYFCNEGSSRPKDKVRKDGSVVRYHPPNTIRLTIRPYERRKLDKRAQKTGAAPNLVHSFDAAHLTTTVTSCPFPVTTIHDSFGCHAGNMEDLFRIVRETFVSFYETNPLEQVLEQVGASELIPEKGDLDLTAILDSDFAFA